jgi:hypothetical protein
VNPSSFSDFFRGVVGDVGAWLAAVLVCALLAGGLAIWRAHIELADELRHEKIHHVPHAL